MSSANFKSSELHVNFLPSLFAYKFLIKKEDRITRNVVVEWRENYRNDEKPCSYPAELYIIYVGQKL